MSQSVNTSIYTVSDVTSRVKKFLSQEFSSVWVKGEVREARVSGNGHLFFTIKDEKATLSCVIFYNRLRVLKFKIEPGIVFNCFGSVTVYEQRGSYQLVVSDVAPEGQGEFELAFNQLKTKLEQEGLFDPSHKKPIPKYASRIGLVTSSQGAAVRDIIKTIDVEFPQVEIMIFPVAVQGEPAGEEIAQMIQLVNQRDWVDLIILTRGGGSREDLWAFNEEVVARAIFASNLPIISAVGHERDWLISDYVADYRASTPTEAANYISQFKKSLIYEIPQLTKKLNQSMEGFVMRLRLKFKDFSYGHWFKLFKGKVSLYQHESNTLVEKMNLLLKQRVREQANDAGVLIKKLESLSPEGVLKRGFAILSQGDRLVTDLNDLGPDDQVTIHLKKDCRKARIL